MATDPKKDEERKRRRRDRQAQRREREGALAREHREKERRREATREKVLELREGWGMGPTLGRRVLTGLTDLVIGRPEGPSLTREMFAEPSEIDPGTQALLDFQRAEGERGRQAIIDALSGEPRPLSRLSAAGAPPAPPLQQSFYRSPPPSILTPEGARRYEERQRVYDRPLRQPAPRPGLYDHAVTAIPQLVGAGLRAAADPLGDLLGRDEEQQRRIAERIHGWGERLRLDRPIANPMFRGVIDAIAPDLTPEERGRLGLATQELSGVPNLMRVAEGAGEIVRPVGEAAVPVAGGLISAALQGDPMAGDPTAGYRFQREHIQPWVRDWARATEDAAGRGERWGQHSRAAGWLGSTADVLDASLSRRLVRSPLVDFDERQQEEILETIPRYHPAAEFAAEMGTDIVTSPTTYGTWWTRLPTWAKLATLGAEAGGQAYLLPYDFETSPFEAGAGAALGYPALTGAGKVLAGAGRRALSSGVGDAVRHALAEGQRAGFARAGQARAADLRSAAELARSRGNVAAAEALERRAAGLEARMPEASRLGRAMYATGQGAQVAGAAGLLGGAGLAIAPASGAEGSQLADEAGADRGGQVAAAVGAVGAGEEGDMGGAALAGTVAAAAAGGGRGPRFYSRLRRRIEAGPRRGTAQQWIKHLQQGTSKVEREWTGVEGYLSRLPKDQMVTRDELMRVFREGEIEVGRTVHGGWDPELDEVSAQREAMNRPIREAMDEVARVMREAGYSPDEILDFRRYPWDPIRGPVPPEAWPEYIDALSTLKRLLAREDNLGYGSPTEAVRAITEMGSADEVARAYDITPQLREQVERFMAAKTAMEEAEKRPVPADVQEAVDRLRELLAERGRLDRRIRDLQEADGTHYRRWYDRGGTDYAESLLTLDSGNPIVARTVHLADEVNEAQADVIRAIDAPEFDRAAFMDARRRFEEAKQRLQEHIDGVPPDMHRVVESVARAREAEGRWGQLLADLVNFLDDNKVPEGIQARALGEDWATMSSHPRWRNLPQSVQERLEDLVRVTHEAKREALAHGRTANLAGGTDFRRSHWHEKNVIAHARTKIYTDSQGRRVHDIGELQSDWAQQGREHGVGRVWEVIQHGDVVATYPTEAEALAHAERIGGAGVGSKTGVPDMPFHQTEDWVQLLIKSEVDRAIRDGAEVISFTTGRQAAKLYDLSKQFSRVEYVPSGDRGVGTLRAYGTNGEIVLWEDDVSPQRVRGFIGKEAAEKLLSTPRDESGVHVLAGRDLEVSGEGMQKFYDEIVPNAIRKYAKQMGVDLKLEGIHLPKAGLTRRGFVIPDELRHKVQDEGHPLLSVGALIGGGLTASAFLDRSNLETEEDRKVAMAVLGILGLPKKGKTRGRLPFKLAEIANQTLREVFKSGRWNIRIKPERKDFVTRYHDIEYTPVLGENIVEVPGDGPVRQFYNKDLATLDNKGRAVLREDSGYLPEIPAQPEEGVIYRGMSNEEWLASLERGYLLSEGYYNLPGEEGLTYFAVDPKTAASYASGYAPYPFTPTFDRPGIVVKVRRPANVIEGGMGDSRVSPGEVAVEDRIPIREVISVYEGRPYEMSGGSIELHSEHGGPWIAGNGTHAGANLGWREIPLGRSGGESASSLFHATQPRIVAESMPAPAVADSRVPGIMGAPTEVRDAYSAERFNLVVEAANEALERLGLPKPEITWSARTYLDEANRIASIRVKKISDDPAVQDAYENLISSLYGFLGEQNAVVRMQLVDVPSGETAARILDLKGDDLTRALEEVGLGGTDGAVVFHLNRELTTAELDALARLLWGASNEAGLQDLGATRIGNALVFGNFSKYTDKELSDREFADILIGVVERLPDEVRRAFTGDFDIGRTRGAYLGDDWGGTQGEHWNKLFRDSLEQLGARGHLPKGSLEVQGADARIASVFRDLHRRVQDGFAAVDTRFRSRVGGAADAGGSGGGLGSAGSLGLGALLAGGAAAAAAGSEGEGEPAGALAASAGLVGGRGAPRRSLTALRDLIGRHLGRTLSREGGAFSQLLPFEQGALRRAVGLDQTNIDRFLRSLPDDELQRIIRQALPDVPQLRSQGYPVSDDYPVRMPDVERLVYDRPKAGGINPGAVYMDPHTGTRVLVKGGGTYQNPQAEVLADQIEREVFGGLIPTKESEALGPDDAARLADMDPDAGVWTGAGDTFEDAASTYGAYARPYLPIQTNRMGGLVFPLPSDLGELGAVDALRTGLIHRVLLNPDLHFENAVGFRGGRVGSIDAGLTFLDPHGGQFQGRDPLFGTSTPTSDVLHRFILGTPEESGEAAFAAVDIEQALRPVAERVLNLDDASRRRFANAAHDAAAEWTYVGHHVDPDEVADAFEGRLATMPQVVDELIDAVNEARTLPPVTQEMRPRMDLLRDLRDRVECIAPVLGGLMLLSATAAEAAEAGEPGPEDVLGREGLRDLHMAGFTSLIAAMLPGHARRWGWRGHISDRPSRRAAPEALHSRTARNTDSVARCSHTRRRTTAAQGSAVAAAVAPCGHAPGPGTRDGASAPHSSHSSSPPLSSVSTARLLWDVVCDSVLVWWCPGPIFEHRQLVHDRGRQVYASPLSEPKEDDRDVGHLLGAPGFREQFERLLDDLAGECCRILDGAEGLPSPDDRGGVCLGQCRQHQSSILDLRPRPTSSAKRAGWAASAASRRSLAWAKVS